MSADKDNHSESEKTRTGPFDDVIPESGANSEKRRTIKPSPGGKNSRQSRGSVLKKADSQQASVEQDSHTEAPDTRADSAERGSAEQQSTQRHGNERTEQSSEDQSTEERTEKRERVAVELPERHRNALDDIKLHLKRVERLPARDASYNRIIAHALERYYEEIFPGEKL